MKVVKERFTKLLHHGGMRTGPIWQKRFYDFNVCSTAKRIEKLRYIASEPGKAMSGGKTRRVEMEQLPDLCLRRRGRGKGELSGMAAQDNVFRLADPLIRNPRMSGAPGRTSRCGTSRVKRVPPQ